MTEHKWDFMHMASLQNLENTAPKVYFVVCLFVLFSHLDIQIFFVSIFYDL